LVVSDPPSWYREKHMSLKKHLDDLESFRATNNEEGIANACFKIGDIYLQRGKWDEAKEYLREAKAICGKLGNEEGGALTAIGLGDVYRNTRILETARTHYEQALDFFEKKEDEKNIANMVARLGELARDQGDLSRALEAFSRAGDICRAHQDQLGEAHFNEKMALVYRNQEEFELAIERFEEALKYYEQHRVADRLAFVLTGLGELQYKAGQPKKALEYLGQALNLYQKLGARTPAELVAAEIAAIEAALEDKKKGMEKI
jgi:tetratricopeptide (TPR) repeat protein